MKTIYRAAIITILSAVTATAAATEKNPAVSLDLGIGIGGPIGLIGASDKSPTSDKAIGNFTVRLGFPRFSRLSVEASAYGGSAATLGINMLIETFRIKKVRVSLLNPGVSWNPDGRGISLSSVRRKWDLTLGAGIDWKASKMLTCSVSWRAFLPSPSKVISYYGNFAVPIFKEALRAGFLTVEFRLDVEQTVRRITKRRAK